MGPSTSTKSASEQLPMAIVEEYQLIQIAELHKLDYRLFHNQIHFFDEQIRKQTRTNGPVRQHMMEYLQERRALAASNLVHRRGKWTEYVGKIEVSRRRIKALEKLTATEEMEADKQATGNQDGKEEEVTGDEDADEEYEKIDEAANEAKAEEIVADDALSEGAGAEENALSVEGMRLSVEQ